jgi:hypothetical protein
MQLRPNSSARDAHSQLVMQLCEALSNFVAATAGETGIREPAADLPANDDQAPLIPTLGYNDIIGLRGILLEFGLKQPQVMTLRKECGFPEPIGPTRPLMFRRDEVERWIRSKPNAGTYAIALRRRSRIPRQS